MFILLEMPPGKKAPAGVKEIVAVCVNPPIPVREFDWQATWGDPEPNSHPVGRGATAEEAVTDLMEQGE